jgi:hypothetical protein
MKKTMNLMKTMINPLTGLRAILTIAVMLCGGFIALNAFPKIALHSASFLSGTPAGNEFVVMIISMLILGILIGGMYLTDVLIFAQFDRPDIKRWIGVLCALFICVDVALNVYVMGEKSALSVAKPTLYDATDKLKSIDKDIERLESEMKDIHKRNSYKGNTYIIGQEKKIIQEKGLQISRLIDEKTRISKDADFKNEILMSEFKSEQATAKAIGQWQGGGLSVLILVFVFFRSKLTNTKHYYILGEQGQRIHQEQQADKVYSVAVKEEVIQTSDSLTDLLKDVNINIAKDAQKKTMEAKPKSPIREARRLPQGLEEALFKYWATGAGTQKEIAEAFSIPHSTVNDHYRRIRKDFESGAIRFEIHPNPNKSEKSDESEQSEGISTDFELINDDYNGGGVMEWRNRVN